MRLLRAWMVLFSIAAAWLGCAPSGPSEEELVGTWQATKIEYVSTTGQGQVDIVPLGAGMKFELHADKTGVFTFTRVGGHPVDVMTGTWESSVDLFRFILAPNNDWSWDMMKSGAQLLLNRTGASWDFNDDGFQEDADEHVTLTKL
jgi:hypothetical protein